MECKQQHLFPITHSNKRQKKEEEKHLNVNAGVTTTTTTTTTMTTKSQILSWNMSDGWNCPPTGDGVTRAREETRGRSSVGSVEFWQKKVKKNKIILCSRKVFISRQMGVFLYFWCETLDSTRNPRRSIKHQIWQIRAKTKSRPKRVAEKKKDFTVIPVKERKRKLTEDTRIPICDPRRLWGRPLWQELWPKNAVLTRGGRRWRA